ncbi:glycosyltransferase family 4 protein [Adonisia turfae]|uniref:Glycosyltransferase family 1 protein n=1 Tax=Adonisia turfae CCMR0081 TaxID=2292702 RepID=A0A6M0RRL8_9CYAN|nr:glycosyltransferase family 4 protein [Adonisia turfae]NEZ58816.1 glycosyltransferase family 1 protein [Adonisia turfae CCMR0081]
MRGLYVTNIDPQISIGYLPKIFGQVKGFSQLGCDMDLLCFNYHSQVVFMHCPRDTEELHELKTLKQQHNNLLIRRWSLLRAAIHHILDTNPDFLYLRYPRSEPLYLYFLDRIRKHFPKLLILSEFPTYPYDKEYCGSLTRKQKTVFLLDKITRRYLRYFIDRIIAINYEKSIFGINTISIDNGINPQDYQPISNLPVLLETINIIGVANVSPWHGYDRLIKGLGAYYRESSSPRYKVIFHIVGAQGAYLRTLLTLVEQEHVSHAVIFHGPKQGKELDTLFVGCHLALGVLGGHRKGLAVMSPLKNREYCARGIPFIFSHVDPDFPENFQYCLQLEADESPLDIKQIVSFILDLSNENNVAFYMRNYACKYFNWPIKLTPVYDYLNAELARWK